MTGRATSSTNLRSISQTIFFRFSGSACIDCWSTSLSTLGVAIAGVVAVRAADVVLVELLVGIVDAGLAHIEADRVVLLQQLRLPIGRVDRIELGLEVDFTQLADQDRGGVAVGRDIAGRDRNGQPLV